MSYKKAKHILPLELLKEIQKYVEGRAFIYQEDRTEKSPVGLLPHL